MPHLNNRLPTSLSQLPTLTDATNEIDDAWGHPIQYRTSPIGVVTLTSFGRDGVRGGIGEDADIVGSFPTKDNDRWVGEESVWIKDPR